MGIIGTLLSGIIIPVFRGRIRVLRFLDRFEYFRKRPLVVAPTPKVLMLRKDVKYNWCSCGRSAKQPWCDGSHLKLKGVQYKPVTFSVNQDAPRSLCMCKRGTTTPPYCSGHHVHFMKKMYDRASLSMLIFSFAFVGSVIYLLYSPEAEALVKKQFSAGKVGQNKAPRQIPAYVDYTKPQIGSASATSTSSPSETEAVVEPRKP
eukprot:TRINITY_DN1720_c0_g1_i1.p1 TRINITY_DN1720_c0_g1~~TRINITY_DN1720_c0_g1_i1.p1  ORF type:complete len:229 (+),score=14.16 TRINITY_DN1720_c0_g1_i1:76-687(+)